MGERALAVFGMGRAIVRREGTNSGVNNMKKLFGMLLGIGLVGFGAQGCTGADYKGDAEDVGSQAEAVSAACSTNSGIFPTKAALAVAMGIEIGIWDPLNQLEVGNQQLVLKAGVKCIKNSCKNTNALLGQSTYSPNQS